MNALGIDLATLYQVQTDPVGLEGLGVMYERARLRQYANRIRFLKPDAADLDLIEMRYLDRISREFQAWERRHGHQRGR